MTSGGTAEIENVKICMFFYIFNFSSATRGCFSIANTFLQSMATSGVQILKSRFANPVFNTLFHQIVFGFGLYLQYKSKVVFGFGLYLCNLEYWIYICLYLDLNLKVFGLNLMNEIIGIQVSCKCLPSF